MKGVALQDLDRSVQQALDLCSITSSSDKRSLALVPNGTMFGK